MDGDDMDGDDRVTAPRPAVAEPLMASLDEVRAAIDRIDDRILALLAQRQQQVTAAAGFKTDDAAVRAPERRAAMMARLRERAAQEGVDPEVVTATWTAMIDAFVALELRELHDHR